MRLSSNLKVSSNGMIQNQRGVALIMAVLISVAIMALAAGVLYFITQSTMMSGAIKRYATAQEAADGAVEAVKDAIRLTLQGGQISNLFPANCSGAPGTAPATVTLATAIVSPQGQPCQTQIVLPGTANFNYTAQTTVQRLYTVAIPGGRLEFARGGGATGTAVFFRITVSVIDPNNTRAENSALYRYTQ